MITFLKWDSDFFGKKIARITVKTDCTTNELDQIINKFFQKDYDCGYLVIPSETDNLVDYCLSKHYFLADKKAVLKKESKTFKIKRLFEVKTQVSTDKLGKLRELSHQIAETSRFFKDPNFRPYAFKLYETWISESIKKNKCFFIFESGIPIGLITLKVIDNNPYIDLFGVDKLYRKRGIGTMLLEIADTWAKDNGYNNIFVTTQADNNIAFLVYKKHGFRPEKMTRIFHIWRKYDKNPL